MFIAVSYYRGADYDIQEMIINTDHIICMRRDPLTLPYGIDTESMIIRLRHGAEPHLTGISGTRLVEMLDVHPARK